MLNDSLNRGTISSSYPYPDVYLGVHVEEVEELPSNRGRPVVPLRWPPPSENQTETVAKSSLGNNSSTAVVLPPPPLQLRVETNDIPTAAPPAYNSSVRDLTKEGGLTINTSTGTGTESDFLNKGDYIHTPSKSRREVIKDDSRLDDGTVFDPPSYCSRVRKIPTHEVEEKEEEVELQDVPL